MNKPSLTIPLAILAGGLIVAVAVYVVVRGQEPSTSSGRGNPALVDPVTSSDHIYGNPAASVKIVEYSDYDCTFCKQFHDTLRQVIASEGAHGDVAWVLREFPLTEIHPDSLKLAEAAECAAHAGGNDAFWNYADALFAGQPTDPTELGTLAARLRIPADAFTTCMTNASSTVDARIAADRANALATGARGTPYSLILVSGRSPIVMDGAYPYDAVKQLVEQALTQK